MEWEIYKLIYKAEGPIRVGALSLGYVLRTRHYVTGKAMWGSATAKLTRAYKGLDYVEVGEFFKNSAILSYFYPMIYNPEEKIYLPRYTDKGVFYAELSRENFERCFVSSIGLTALIPQSLTAEQGTLHETEFLLPTNLDGVPVFFIGYIFLKKGRFLKDKGNGNKERVVDWDRGEICLKEVLQSLQVGGERKYGFGRMVLYKNEEMGNKKPFMFGNSLILNESEVKVKIEKGNPITAHLDVKANMKMKGDIEPLVGREVGESGAGQKITEARICWVPGSIPLESKPLSIGSYGILK